MKLKFKMSELFPKFKSRIKFGLKKINLSERQKKISSTVFVAAIVCGFYLWLGIGLVKYIPQDSRTNLSSLLIMYAIFPILVLFFSIKRIVGILLGKEDREILEPVKDDNFQSGDEKETAKVK